MKFCKNCYYYMVFDKEKYGFSTETEAVCLANPPIAFVNAPPNSKKPQLIALYPPVQSGTFCRLWVGKQPIDKLTERINDNQNRIAGDSEGEN